MAEYEAGARRPNHRPQRVGEAVRRALGAIFLNNLAHVPNIMHVSITEARMSPDLRNATVYFRMLTTQADAPAMAKLLKLNSGGVRHLLAKELTMRYVPQLHFVHDASEDSARRIDALLQNTVPAPEGE